MTRTGVTMDVGLVLNGRHLMLETCEVIFYGLTVEDTRGVDFRRQYHERYPYRVVRWDTARTLPTGWKEPPRGR